MTKRVRSRHDGRTHKKYPEGLDGRLDYRGRMQVQQAFEKYMTLARESAMAGDIITAESHYQHAEHYLRILNEYKAIQEELNEKAAQQAFSTDQDSAINNEPVEVLDAAAA